MFYKLSKTLPQKNIASTKRKPSTQSRKPNSAWRGGRGWVELLKTCTSYILDTELQNTMWLSYQSSHTNPLHIKFWMKYNFHYMYMSVWVKEMLFGPPHFKRIWRHCMPIHYKMTLVHRPVIMTSSCVTLKLFLGFIFFQFHVLDENWEIIIPFLNVINIATIQNRRYVWRCSKRWLCHQILITCLIWPSLNISV